VELAVALRDVMILWLNNQHNNLHLIPATGGIALNIYDTHEFNAAGVQNLFILIPNEAHHGPAHCNLARSNDTKTIDIPAVTISDKEFG
jgi:hypothetical protein